MSLFEADAISHRCGALMGLAIGDALGTTNEFKTLKAPVFPGLAIGPLEDIKGGGPFGVKAGQVTDDTQMACCLYLSLATHGAYDIRDAAQRYVAWAKHAFDVGGQISSALAVMKPQQPTSAGRAIWLAAGKHPAANGSLMRTAPIGALLAAPIERRTAAVLDSAITHFDPKCRISCAALDSAIAAGIAGASAEEMHGAAVAEVADAAALIGEDYESDDLSKAIEAVREDLGLASTADPDLYGDTVHIQKSQGFVRVAFRLAFWELLHRDGFAEAVLDVANRGGDADTNAAITGALVGSAVGIEGVPAEWRELVLNCAPPNPWGPSGLYHPQVFDCT